MQPILENAVEDIQSHTKGDIVIRIYSKDGSIYLEVEHNGVLSEEDKEKIARLLSEEEDTEKESSNNLGIRNVNQRLKIIYGEKSGLSINMNKESRILARIIISIEQERQ